MISRGSVSSVGGGGGGSVVGETDLNIGNAEAETSTEDIVSAFPLPFSVCLWAGLGFRKLI